MQLISVCWLCILQFHQINLLVLIVFNGVFIEFTICKILSPANCNNFTFSLLIWMIFITFSCLIALNRTSNTMLNRNGKSGHPCLVPKLRGRDLKFTIEFDINCGLFIYGLD